MYPYTDLSESPDLSATSDEKYHLMSESQAIDFSGPVFTYSDRPESVLRQPAFEDKSSVEASEELEPTVSPFIRAPAHSPSPHFRYQDMLFGIQLIVISYLVENLQDDIEALKQLFSKAACETVAKKLYEAEAMLSNASPLLQNPALSPFYNPEMTRIDYESPLIDLVSKVLETAYADKEVIAATTRQPLLYLQFLINSYYQFAEEKKPESLQLCDVPFPAALSKAYADFESIQRKTVTLVGDLNAAHTLPDNLLGDYTRNYEQEAKEILVAYFRKLIALQINLIHQKIVLPQLQNQMLDHMVNTLVDTMVRLDTNIPINSLNAIKDVRTRCSIGLCLFLFVGITFPPTAFALMILDEYRHDNEAISRAWPALWTLLGLDLLLMVVGILNKLCRSTRFEDLSHRLYATLIQQITTPAQPAIMPANNNAAQPAIMPVNNNAVTIDVTENALPSAPAVSVTTFHILKNSPKQSLPTRSDIQDKLEIPPSSISLTNL